MSKQTANDLRAARALIERGWCKREFARRANGTGCEPTDPEAVRFCMVGAIVRAIDGNDSQDEAQGALVEAVNGARGLIDLGEFNDTRRNKAAILAVFDRAIAAEEAAE